MACPNMLAAEGLTREEMGIAISQLNTPCKTPSMTKMFRIVGERVLIARKTPISFVRSITPMESAPIKAIPPTTATIMDNAIAHGSDNTKLPLVCLAKVGLHLAFNDFHIML